MTTTWEGPLNSRVL
uniref:Uncharacterized protein n=1 Tax=Arundo donax TaxID=35708 RepID=A0A0A8ZXK9_ARUDO